MNACSVIAHVVLVSLSFVFFGCSSESADSDPAPPKMTREEALQKCFQESGERLEAALANRSVANEAAELVSELDDFEDFVQGEKAEIFEKFHQGAEELQRMATEGNTSDLLQQKIDELKDLSLKFTATAS